MKRATAMRPKIRLRGNAQKLMSEDRHFRVGLAYWNAAIAVQVAKQQATYEGTVVRGGQPPVEVIIEIGKRAEESFGRAI